MSKKGGAILDGTTVNEICPWEIKIKVMLIDIESRVSRYRYFKV